MVPLLAVDRAAESHVLHGPCVRILDGSHGGICDPTDLVVRSGPVEHDLRSSEGLAPMDDGDLGGELCQEERLFHRAVAAADDRHGLPAKEEAVASRARTHSVADEGLFRFETQPTGRRAGCNDQGLGFELLVADPQFEWTGGKVRSRDFPLLVGRAETLGLLLHPVDEIGSHDPLWKPGKVLHIRCERELTAGLQPLHDQRLEAGTRGVNGCRVSGAARSDNDDVVHGSKSARMRTENPILSVRTRGLCSRRAGVWD